jgi:alkanesulfonate monooxygenase SsuD/methylene tetrahydromethanopterin reductase-like flavin-dependent oxidoreductase (luciferase family)
MTDWFLIRDDAAEARRVLGSLAAANGDSLGDDDACFVGSPQKVADELRPVVELGYRHILIDAMAPYDAETIERLPELRELLSA